MVDKSEPDLTIDARGLRCPLPVLKAQKALRGLEVGAQLLITTTDPVSPLDLTHFCQEQGHTMLSRTDHDDGSFEFVIIKG